MKRIDDSSVYVEGEYIDFILNDPHQTSRLVLLFTSSNRQHVPFEELVKYVNELNDLVSVFHKNSSNYSFGDFSLDHCTTDTLMAILEMRGSLRGGATGAMGFSVI
ncbi:hypothetical protein L5515_009626 [Caenorhabditis briggsae]|uniref:Uncharacterized protein n=1 Tax=Caenorhabditis briggsae TaxID=6238 RepID=A0AAE9JMH8_CAEBR|nr:hypothetical protein L5515_009626 [Caenorhabditis briggsae]